MNKKIDFSYKPVIEGEKVILRPFQSTDWEQMVEILNDANLKKLTGSVSNDEEANTPFTIDEIEKMKEWYYTRNEQIDRLDLAIVEKHSMQVIGEVVFNEYDEDAGNVNFRILIGKNGRNKGLGTQAVKLFIDYGLKVLGIHRIELEVYRFNERAERVYQKAGFRFEGMKRENFIYNNNYIDTKIYAILQSDYIANEITIEQIGKEL